MRKCSLIVLLAALSVSSCKEKEVPFSSNTCKRLPPFVHTMGFDPNYSFFSTSDIKTMGLVLQQTDQPGNPNATIIKSIQDPSWKKGGWLAPVLLDKQGNIFSAPVPFISVLDNPVSNNNTIYKVDANTAVMDEFMRLPLRDSLSVQNPFGIIGMALLCETGTLYVSTLSGSDRRHERGAIYAIDIARKKIIDEITATDAMGMGISYIAGKRQLFFGTGRSSDIYSVDLDAGGEFKSSPRVAFSLEGTGNDKVRRITTDAAGNLQVHGIEFDYNLKPQREKRETIYKFFYDKEAKKWALK